jgi:hypothetical protein
MNFAFDQDALEKADWWAHAQFQGARLTVEHENGPVEAVVALAGRLLEGAKCRRCGKPIMLDDDGEGCRWTRQGKKWEPGCGLPIDMTIPVPR